MEIKRCYDTIIGASVGWNQLIENGDFADGTTGWSATSSATLSASNNVLTVHRDSGEGIVGGVSLSTSSRPNTTAGHKYILIATLQTQGDTSVSLIPTGTSSQGQRAYEKFLTKTRLFWIWNCQTEASATLEIRGFVGAGVTSSIDFTVEDYNCTDLTAEFGSTIADYIYSLESATAGSGIAKLREWGFLKGYQAYNAGSIESVEVTGKKVRGFNQWDEVWENGRIKTTTGENDTGTGIRTKNYVPVLPSTTYYVKALANTFIIEYDADKNYVRYASYRKDAEYTTSANAYYIRFYQVDITTYGNDICINLSSSRNGEYEPYTEQSYDYGTDTLNGIFKLDANNQLYADGDVKTSDGTITRKYGIRAYQSGDESLADAFTNGIQTVYKLTTPTTEQGDPFPSPQIVYPDGTEEYITGNGVPVGHETRYEL